MRRVITVPKDKSAMQALDYDIAADKDLDELVLDDNEFNLLWGASIFDKINQLTGALIDDHEDESIVKRPLLEKVVSSDIFNRSHHPAELDRLITEVKSMFVKALEYETGVFFYF